MAKIAQAYRVNIQTLAQANRINNPSELQEDAVIFIPQPGQIPAPETASSADVSKGKDTVPLSTEKAQRAKKQSEQAPQGNKRTVQQKDREQHSPPPSSTAISRKEPISKPLWTDSDSPPPSGAGRTATRQPDALVHEKGRFVWPLRGKVVNRYGLQANGMYYNHIRIVTRSNAPVGSAASGVIIFSAPLKDFGETVIVKHDQRFATVYTHLGSRLVKVDQRVKQGDQIGSAGKSQTKNEGFIHFEIREHNKSKNPLLFLP